MDKYQEQFPLPVRVCKGFYGSSDRTSVSEGDAFNIHFVKRSKVPYWEEGVIWEGLPQFCAMAKGNSLSCITNVLTKKTTFVFTYGGQCWCVLTKGKWLSACPLAYIDKFSHLTQEIWAAYLALVGIPLQQCMHLLRSYQMVLVVSLYLLRIVWMGKFLCYTVMKKWQN